MHINRNLGVKIIFYIGILLITAILISFYLNNEAHEKELIDITQLQVHRLTDTIKNAIRHTMMTHGNNKEVQTLIEGMGEREDVVKVYILDKGTVKASSWREEVGKVFTNKKEEGCGLCHFHNQNTPPLTVFINRIYRDKHGKRFIELFNPIENEPLCYSCHQKDKQVLGILTVVTSLSRMDKSILAGKKVMIISTFIIFLLVSLEIFYFIYRFVHSPIQKLTSATRRVADGDIDYHITIQSTDEIGELASSFNVMTQKLKKSWSEIEAWNRELAKKVEDATVQLRETNRELEETNSRLKVADQKKTDILVTVAHDIRGPLSAIKNCIGVVVGGYLSKDPTKQMEMLERANQRVNELLRFTNNLLDLSLIEEPWQQEKNVDCVLLLDSLMPGLSNIAQKQGISLRYRTQEDLPLLKGDKELIVKVFSYIADNAIKYSHPEGAVSIECIAEDGCLSFVVTDQGIGIPEEEISSIFEPTFRGELARKHNQSGTGVSMALVEKIILLHKGKISVESRVGQGTTVKVTLPFDCT